MKPSPCILLFFTIIATSGCRTLTGTSATKIHGGTAVDDPSDPIAKATVLLLAPAGGICSGTVLAPDIVLSAAHCAVAFADHIDSGILIYRENPRKSSPVSIVTKMAYPKNYIDAGIAAVKAGTTKWASENPSKWDQFQLLGAKISTQTNSSTEQKEYDSLKNELDEVIHLNSGIPMNDVALFKLGRPLDSSATIVPIATTADQLAIADTVVAAGFGVTGPADSDLTTKMQLFKFSTKVKSADGTQKQISIVDSTNESTCHGDSGGPLYILSDDSISVIGALSRIRSSPDCGTHGTYTDLRAYREWIACQMNYLRSGDTKCLSESIDTIYLNRTTSP